MASALVVAAVVRNGDVHVTDSYYASRRKRAAKAWGDGVFLRIRIEPKDEAVAHYQFKHLYGHVFEPVAESTGHTSAELCLMAKAKFMPDDGRTSLTELSYEEMRAFSEQTEQWLREECPEAFLVN